MGPASLPEPRDPATAAADRRGAERHPHQAPIELCFESAVSQGVVQDLSELGVLFASSSCLRVRVRFPGPGGALVERTGQLVRVQRMGSASFGYAVEFDARSSG